MYSNKTLFKEIKCKVFIMGQCITLFENIVEAANREKKNHAYNELDESILIMKLKALY